MKMYRWVRRAGVLLALGLMLALAACSTGGTGTQANTSPTDTPAAAPTATPTPTLTPSVCNSNFSAGYVSTLPDATFKATNVFARVQLPPETRSFDNDAAGGMRGRNMCSGGTTQSVSDFMTQHLTQLGWQKTGMSTHGCLSGGPFYAQQQCWQNGKYALVVGINSNLDWIILFYDPDFI